MTNVTFEGGLDVRGQKLTIKDLTAADMGPYTCQAKNALDAAEFMTFLNVFGE